MIVLIVVTGIVLFLVYYVTRLPFEVGTGYTEKKKSVREGVYHTRDVKSGDNSTVDQIIDATKQ